MSVYDVIVIGAGPGGYVAAIRAAQLGMKVAIVEREHLGGICLNWGCIPAKALLRSAEILHFAEHASSFGLNLKGTVEPNPVSIVARSRAISKRLNEGVGYLLRKNKVDLIWGEAAIDRPGQITVRAPSKRAVEPAHTSPKTTLGSGIYQTRNIIVATGARPRALPGLEPDGRLVWTYFNALVAQEIPKSLLVVGSGAIGIEFATFFHTMGAGLTVVELQSQILPAEDQEIAAHAHKHFEKIGMRIFTGAKVVQLEKRANSVVATIQKSDGQTTLSEFDRVLSAVGVVGNIENLGLERLGVKTDKGCIVTDGLGRTNVAGVHAIGDVAGPPMLAHKAEHEGVICVEALQGLSPHELDPLMIPACTYSHPQIASVGLTEAKARSLGKDIKVGRFPFQGNGKAMTLGEAQGLVKTIFDAHNGQLLGAHMIGAEVTELIHGFVLAMKLESTEAELMQTVFPHPTLSEMLHESVLDAHGRAIHI